MSEYIVNFDGELGMALAIACTGAGFACEKIVRCKDCKYFGYLGDDMCYRPNGDGGFSGWKVDPKGFCAWGELEVVE